MKLKSLINELLKYKVLNLLLISQAVIAVTTTLIGTYFIYSYFEKNSEAELERQKSIIYKNIQPQNEEIRAWAQMKAIEPLQAALDKINKELAPNKVFIKELSYEEAKKTKEVKYSIIFPQEISIYNASYIVATMPEYRFYDEIMKLKLFIPVVLLFLVSAMIFTVFFVNSYIYKPIKTIINETNNNEFNVSASAAKGEIKVLLEKAIDYRTIKHELEISKKLSELASQVAHDIRAPISALKMSTSVFRGLSEKESLSGSDLNVGLEIMGTACDQIYSVAQKLLKERKAGLYKSKETVQSAIESAVRMVTITNPEVSVKCEMEATPEISMPGLTTVLTNLLKNAAEASKAGEEVKISARKLKEGFEIKVHDKGSGIPKMALDEIRDGKIFTTKKDGNRIGLSSALSWASSNKVNLEIDSPESGGTEIKILI